MVELKQKRKLTLIDFNVTVNKPTSISTPSPIVKSIESSLEKNEDHEEKIPIIKDIVLPIVKKSSFDPFTLKHPPRSRQKEAFDWITQNKSVCALLPTGYGKTNIAMFACQKCKNEGKIFIIIAPLKALVTEHSSDAKFGEYFNIVQISGDYQENKKRFSDPSVDGFILTFEMLFQMLLTEQYQNVIIQRVGLVVIDEAHLVCDKSRGHRLEAIHYLLEYFHPTCKKILLSATVGNGKEFAEHFKCVPVIAEAIERPVKLNKEFYPHQKVFSSAQKYQLATQNVDSVIRQYIQNPKFPNILFFVMSREDVTKIANYINNAYNRYHVYAGMHHAGMTKEARHETEENYRNGKINIVVCTTTLSMGLDMPTDVCVMLGMTFYEFRKSAEKLMDSNQAIQILGRAGRGNGTLPEGYTHMFYPSEYDSNVKSMVGRPLKIESQIPSHLDYILLAYLVAGIPEKDLLEMYQQTFVDHLDLELYHKTLKWLKDCGFVNQLGYPTDLGTKCIWFALEPKTALHVVELKKVLDKVSELDYPTLFGLMIMNDEYCGNIAVRKNAQYDQIALRNASNFLHEEVFTDICTNNIYFLDKINTYFQQMNKAFAMTYSYHLETKFQCEKISVNNNDLYLLRSSAQRIIKGFHQIIGDSWKFGKQFRLLDKSLQSSNPVFDKEMLRMMQIKGLTSKPAFTLNIVGILTLEDIVSLTDAQLKSKAIEIKKWVDSEKKLKPYDKTFVTITEMRLKNWRMDASNVLNHDDKEVQEIRTSEIDSIDTKIQNPIDIDANAIWDDLLSTNDASYDPNDD